MFLTCHVTNVVLHYLLPRRRIVFFYHLIFGKRCIFTLGGVHGRTLGVLPLHLQKQKLAFPVLEDVGLCSTNSFARKEIILDNRYLVLPFAQLFCISQSDLLVFLSLSSMEEDSILCVLRIGSFPVPREYIARHLRVFRVLFLHV
jgi:hypothetical protein